MAVPTVQYLVAFNNNGTDDPAAITTVASPAGSLGAKNVWTDISRFVLSDSGVRGRNHDYASFQAGTRTLTLRNDDGRFTPWNTSGPYTPFVQPRQPFQVRVVWSGVTYTRFTGQIDSWTSEWPDAVSQTATLHATDGFRLLNTAAMSGDVYVASVLLDAPAGLWTCSGQPTVDSGFHTFMADSTTGNHPLDLGVLATVNYTFAQTGPFASSTNTSIATAPVATIPTDVITPASGTSFTVEGWFKTAAAAARSEMLWAVGLTGPWVAVITNGATGNVWAGGIGVGLTGTANVADNNWHHIVFYWDSGTGNTALVVDGTVDASGNSGAATWSGAASWFYWNAGLGAGWTDYSGSFANLARYNTALSNSQAFSHYRAGAQTFPQETTDQRVNACLAIAPWPGGARNIDTGSSSIQAVSSFGQTSVLQHLQEIEASELGAVFVTADGKIRFVSRHNLWSNSLYRTTQATFGDNTAGGDIPYQPGVQLPLSDLDIYNDAVATRTGGTQQQTVDNTSIQTYGRQTWNPGAALYNTTDAEVLAMTGVIVGKYRTPAVRIPQVTIDVYSTASSLPATMPGLLALDVLYRVLVERTLMPGGGTAFSQTANIEQITETITPTSWTLTFDLAKPDLIWVLGYSQLGVDTMLGY